MGMAEFRQTGESRIRASKSDFEPVFPLRNVDPSRRGLLACTDVHDNALKEERSVNQGVPQTFCIIHF